jgi:hypothetical protein
LAHPVEIVVSDNYGLLGAVEVDSWYAPTTPTQIKTNVPEKSHQSKPDSTWRREIVETSSTPTNVSTISQEKPG